MFRFICDTTSLLILHIHLMITKPLLDLVEGEVKLCLNSLMTVAAYLEACGTLVGLKAFFEEI